uniref:Uncharacterized protein n=1 Tax=Denticeps clupeoides TaxID=299321 RepID=A0AAY4DHD7_9TELE
QPGEQCECVNPCCNATACTLRVGAVCAHGDCQVTRALSASFPSESFLSSHFSPGSGDVSEAWFRLFCLFSIFSSCLSFWFSL